VDSTTALHHLFLLLVKSSREPNVPPWLPEACNVQISRLLLLPGGVRNMLAFSLSNSVQDNPMPAASLNRLILTVPKQASSARVSALGTSHVM
jgi:hypothetical protein